MQNDKYVGKILYVGTMLYVGITLYVLAKFACSIYILFVIWGICIG